ncbi:MAG TPA: DUF255 domain-containing protein [Luteitalea sp.]|nr:DUF255 domain-containing protein [Luteitalea sp.]
MSHLRAIIEPVPPVDWQPWHTAAFLDAQRRRRPVLLLLETAWAPTCAAAHATVFARPDVQQAIAETVVPIRVDADRRPDIADRYGLGSWPSVLVLTPEGRVVTGGTRLDAGLADRLRQVAIACGTNDRAWRSGATDESSPAGTGSPSASIADDVALARIAAGIWAARDPASGGWSSAGRAGADCTLFALSHGLVTGATEWREAVIGTLDDLCAMAAAGSGLFELHAPGDEGAPLGACAAWVVTLARAIPVTGRTSWRTTLDRAARALAGARHTDGSWRPWPGATLVLVDVSALACRALFAAAELLDDAELTRQGIDALEALAPVAYARGAGVSHVLEQQQARGPMLLDDAMMLAHAALDAQAWRAETVYRDLADELLQTSIARLTTPTGVLTDRVAALAGGGRIGRLAEPWPSLAGNALAARLAVRLRPDDRAAVGTARGWLRGVAPSAVEAGPFGASVGLALQALETPGHVVAAW